MSPQFLYSSASSNSSQIIESLLNLERSATYPSVDFFAGKRTLTTLHSNPSQLFAATSFPKTLNLTSSELHLFTLLKSTPTPPSNTLRVAGGWVRDKILSTLPLPSPVTSRLSHRPSLTQTSPVDIDIALSSVLGVTFASNFKELAGSTSSRVGVVGLNPEKSKHLETATMTFGSFYLDFVNLRTDTYTGSRIPDVKFGSPREDAFRRDLTINSLFFNLESMEVEDYTGMGLRDLRDGIIRTPLSPVETLLDDPLRVLRAVRFASRLRFEICRELREAVGEEEVRKALREKVSRERFGRELDLIMSSDDPVGGVRLIVNLNLEESVFGRRIGRGESVLQKAWEVLENEEWQEEGRRRLWYASALVEGMETQDGKNVMKDMLKLPGKETEKVHIIQQTSKKFLELLEQGGDVIATALLMDGVKVEGFEGDRTDPIWKEAMEMRFRLAQILRYGGSSWRDGFVLATAERLAALDLHLTDESLETREDEENAEMQRFEALQAAIVELDLTNVAKLQPLLNGEEVKRILPGLPRGPGFRTVLDGQMKFMIMNPGVGREEVEGWMEEEFESFKYDV
ncbi:hypothetical protein TrVE_jg10220 [Triparma verrucosa]|uniref:Poly A polymerase head domain-containing protein n=1 Tax=Triparma verrucosa TaxID=1606542 RepID=A0A9W7B4Y7_9STRA|nr:hypothetical protein TrVE_jg10220 [Triparma verrucosa]